MNLREQLAGLVLAVALVALLACLWLGLFSLVPLDVTPRVR
ncbi:MAG TPA: hypothetical protein VNK94_05095 [Gaiellaceae bacterium]|nr:hypothetical protein [Gaiellaceae bacterium]